MPSTKYTRELLAPIVASSNTVSDVLRKLGLPTSGGNYRHISMRIRLAELDTSHFGSNTLRGRVEAIPADVLERLARGCLGVAQVLETLHLPRDGRAHCLMTRRLRDLAIDTKHFRGQGWLRGETSATHPSIAQGARRRSLSDEQVFVNNAPALSGRSLARRLLAKGWTYRCTWCGITEWRGQRLVLHLDHINGINNDHRLENLRFLCPNCHSQTETYGNRRRR